MCARPASGRRKSMPRIPAIHTWLPLTLLRCIRRAATSRDSLCCKNSSRQNSHSHPWRSTMECCSRPSEKLTKPCLGFRWPERKAIYCRKNRSCFPRHWEKVTPPGPDHCFPWIFIQTLQRRSSRQDDRAGGMLYHFVRSSAFTRPWDRLKAELQTSKCVTTKPGQIIICKPTHSDLTRRRSRSDASCLSHGLFPRAPKVIVICHVWLGLPGIAGNEKARGGSRGLDF